MFWDDEIDGIEEVDPISGHRLGTFEEYKIYPANLFMTTKESTLRAIHQIEDDLKKQVDFFEENGKPYEAKRLYERVTYDMEMLREHVILDQLYSYTPATNALLAMAQGMVAVSGAEPEYYDLIGERENRPIINVLPYNDDDIAHTIEQIVLHRDRLPELSRRSREFVVKHNDSHLIAQRHIDFWNKIITEKTNHRQ